MDGLMAGNARFSYSSDVEKKYRDARFQRLFIFVQAGFHKR